MKQIYKGQRSWVIKWTEPAGIVSAKLSEKDFDNGGTEATKFGRRNILYLHRENLSPYGGSDCECWRGNCPPCPPCSPPLDHK